MNRITLKRLKTSWLHGYICKVYYVVTKTSAKNCRTSVVTLFIAKSVSIYYTFYTFLSVYRYINFKIYLYAISVKFFEIIKKMLIEQKIKWYETVRCTCSYINDWF